MAVPIHETVVALLKLTLTLEVLWLMAPLVIATIVMTVYFEKYRHEQPGWNTYTANSLVLLFVAMSLFRYIHGIDDLGAINYVLHSGKSIATVLLLFVGLSVLRFNFNHVLPERIAQYLSAPITLSIFAYVVILYVFTDLPNSSRLFIALLFILAIVLLVFSLLRIPVMHFFIKLQKMKEHEKFENVRREKEEILHLKDDLKRRERKMKQVTLKQIEKQKKEALKLKRVVKK